MRVVVDAGENEDFSVSEESIALAWRPIAQMAQTPGDTPSLQRMAQRWLAGHHSLT